jgi:uncharacterized membrane protein
MNLTTATYLILLEGAIGSVVGTMLMDTFFPKSMYSKWVLLVLGTVAYIELKKKMTATIGQ